MSFVCFRVEQTFSLSVVKKLMGRSHMCLAIGRTNLLFNTLSLPTRKMILTVKRTECNSPRDYHGSNCGIYGILNRVPSQDCPVRSQSSIASLRNERKFVYSRTAMNVHSKIRMIVTTAVAAPAAVGGSTKLDVTPEGAGPMGVVLGSNPGGNDMVERWAGMRDGKMENEVC